MLNVLLADDETRTLHHLMTGVPWFQLGMEDVYKRQVQCGA